MIPPLQSLRLRSISRWLNEPKNGPSAEPSPRAMELDALMMEEFERREDDLKAQMMRDKTWGTEQGLTQFPTDRLSLWQAVVSEYLPTTTDQPQET